MRTFLHLFFFLLPCSILLGQNNKKTDSLIEAYQNHAESSEKVELIDKIIQKILYTNPEKAKTYIDEMIVLSKKLNYQKGEAKAYHRLAGYYYNLDILDSSEIYFKKSKAINTHIDNVAGLINDYEQLGLLFNRKKEFDSAFYYLNKNIALYKNRDSTSKNVKQAFDHIGSTYHTLASIYISLGSFNLALKDELQAAKLYKRMGDPLFIADANNSLGAIENELGNYDQALIYLKAATETYEENQDVFFQTLAIINTGVALQGLEEHVQAIKTYKEGLEIAQRNNFRGREGLIWSNMGISYLALNDMQHAKKSFLRAEHIYKELEYPLEISGTYSNMGDLYTKTNKLDSAMVYLDKAINIADSTNFLKISAKAYRYRSEVFKRLHDYKRSIEDFEKFSMLKDSMFNEQKSKQIEELRTLYETEKKEQQIKIQKNEIRLLNIKERVYSLQRLLLAFGLFMALIAVYAFYQRNKGNKLAKEKAQSELEFKTKELTTHALHLAKKNEVLNDLKQKAKAFKADANADPGYQMLIQTINFDLQDDNNWENFSRYFEEVYKGFHSKAKKQFPSITTNDLRFMALLKMNLSSKEIANILNISGDGIKKARQRLRKKMGIEPTESLEAAVIAI